MAESVVFSLASKILSTIASPAFDKAYERGLSIWEARDELAKLRVTIETVQAVLHDAERRQKGSTAVKIWIKRLKEVLYDAEDLFDEVATDDLVKQRMREGNNKLSLKNKVRVSCSKLNPIVSRDSIAGKVKAIRKSLDEISKDMTQFEFLRLQPENPMHGTRVEKDPGSFVDPKYVFGRDEDKKIVLEMLCSESDDAQSKGPAVISVVGIGGMGKTTLAQLIYNDEEVTRKFTKKWFACISDTCDDKEVLVKVLQSISGGNFGSFTTSQVQEKIRNLVANETFLLVLDDVWDDDHARWLGRMSLLSGSAKGSKVIVTTRSSSVAIAVDAFMTHNLQGLSEQDSWELFKWAAFTSERENDPRWITLGREIVKKCARVPLAIRSIGSLLYTKTTIQEWESFKDQELAQLKKQDDPTWIMSVLQLSYDPLPSNLKQCFAYCSIYPKDFRFDVLELIYIWIAQGYMQPNGKVSVEVIGRSYFMSLLRRSFFQEVEKDIYGEIKHCKMHDLVHDLAKLVAGEEILMLKTSSSLNDNNARHVCVGSDYGCDGIIPRVFSMSRLRSLSVTGFTSLNSLLNLDQQFRNGKNLRVLILSNVGIENVPSSIGELKLLRYLDLSWNNFKTLPDSLTNLFRLIALDLSWCMLQALPRDFRKLINIRYLNLTECSMLQHMPPDFEELCSLRHLSNFIVGNKVSEKGVKHVQSGLDALNELKQLGGELKIRFKVGVDEWDDRDEGSWQLPISPKKLHISNYPGIRIPHWANDQVANLVSISLYECSKVKYLSPFRYLPHLKTLEIYKMYELEYMEEETGERAPRFGNEASLFFPSLEFLTLFKLPKWKGWLTTTSMQQNRRLSFPVLSKIYISYCPEIKFMPSSPCIRNLYLTNVQNEAVHEFLSPTSSDSTTSSSLSSSYSCLEVVTITSCTGALNFPSSRLKSLKFLWIENVKVEGTLHLVSPHLAKVNLEQCHGLKSVEVEASALDLKITLERCCQLKRLHFTHPTRLKKFVIREFVALRLASVDWDSLTNLRILRLPRLQLTGELHETLNNRNDIESWLTAEEQLPQCLLQSQARGNLEIIYTPIEVDINEAYKWYMDLMGSGLEDTELPAETSTEKI